MKSLKQLYRQDPRISIGLTSRGTWTVSAGKYMVPTKTWQERFKQGITQKYLSWKRPYLTTQYEILLEVQNAVAWLFSEENESA